MFLTDLDILMVSYAVTKTQPTFPQVIGIVDISHKADISVSLTNQVFCRTVSALKVLCAYAVSRKRIVSVVN